MVAGIDHELLPNFAVGAAYTYRRGVDTYMRDVTGNRWTPRIGVTTADYSLGAPVTRNGYTVTPYVLNAGVTTRAGVTGGRIWTNRPDFYRQYHGLELIATKRMSGKWMSRVLDLLDGLDGPPQRSRAAFYNNPNPIDLDPQIDGGQVIRQGAGSGKALYVGTKWQASANALYLLPAGFEIAGNFYGRQGYPKPIFIQVNTGAFEGTTNVLAQDSDAERLPEPLQPRPPAGQELQLRPQQDLTLSVEGFNVFNAGTETQPQHERQLGDLQPSGGDPGAAHRPLRRSLQLLDVRRSSRPGARVGPGAFSLMIAIVRRSWTAGPFARLRASLARAASPIRSTPVRERARARRRGLQGRPMVGGARRLRGRSSPAAPGRRRPCTSRSRAATATQGTYDRALAAPPGPARRRPGRRRAPALDRAGGAEGRPPRARPRAAGRRSTRPPSPTPASTSTSRPCSSTSPGRRKRSRISRGPSRSTAPTSTATSAAGSPTCSSAGRPKPKRDLRKVVELAPESPQAETARQGPAAPALSGRPPAPLLASRLSPLQTSRRRRADRVLTPRIRDCLPKNTSASYWLCRRQRREMLPTVAGPCLA